MRPPVRPNSIWRVIVGVLRSIDLRCPHCRRARIYRGWYTLHERCPACGVAFQRDEGDFWGGVVFTYTYAGIAGLAAAGLLLQAGQREWLPIALAASAAVLVAVLVLFPFAKAQWIALLFLTRGQYEEYRPPAPGAAEGGEGDEGGERP